MSRCKACDYPLSDNDLKRPQPDDEYCSTCINASNKEYNAGDKEYDHESITGILLDGSILYVDTGTLDESEDQEDVENNENKA